MKINRLYFLLFSLVFIIFLFIANNFFGITGEFGFAFAQTNILYFGHIASVYPLILLIPTFMLYRNFKITKEGVELSIAGLLVFVSVLMMQFLLVEDPKYKGLLAYYVVLNMKKVIGQAGVYLSVMAFLVIAFALINKQYHFLKKSDIVNFYQFLKSKFPIIAEKIKGLFFIFLKYIKIIINKTKEASLIFIKYCKKVFKFIKENYKKLKNRKSKTTAKEELLHFDFDPLKNSVDTLLNPAIDPIDEETKALNINRNLDLENYYKSTDNALVDKNMVDATNVPPQGISVSLIRHIKEDEPSILRSNYVKDLEDIIDRTHIYRVPIDESQSEPTLIRFIPDEVETKSSEPKRDFSSTTFSSITPTKRDLSPASGDLPDFIEPIILENAPSVTPKNFDYQGAKIQENIKLVEDEIAPVEQIASETMEQNLDNSEEIKAVYEPLSPLESLEVSTPNKPIENEIIESSSDNISFNIEMPLEEMEKIKIPLEPQEEVPIKPAEVEEVEVVNSSTAIFEQKLAEQKLPSLEALKEVENTELEINDDEIDKKSAALLSKLEVFKVKGDITAYHYGPVVTRFEFKPNSDVKVSKILQLQDDLAMALQAKSIRIQAPIPGRDVVGIEIPNSKPSMIFLREILESTEFSNSASLLTIALGKDIEGNPFVTDLAKLPHLLVAGTTGSGKSVGINAMLLSLLYRNTKDTLRLIIIDPKKVEFESYSDIPHLLTPIITDPQIAINALNQATKEMDYRYEEMRKARVKSITSYNEYATKNNLKLMPYLVIIIDELADLMMSGGKDCEMPIVRIAQMGRACGMHFIIATQRPSTDVVTGLLKTNMPSRLSYRVGSSIDSKVILDQVGADKLIGNGDALFLTSNTPAPLRLHAPFCTEDEINTITDLLRENGTPEYDNSYLGNNKLGAEVEVKLNLEGDIVEQAKTVMMQDGKCSISYIQRRLNIGYNKAANIIEALENEGFLSKPNARGERSILG